ncbi:MAG: NADPH-dependent 7-cyano-7-deazaguanine reductase [Flavobacteriales bacterium]
MSETEAPIKEENTLLYDQIDKNHLVPIPNPSDQAYEVKIKIPEFTFIGVKNQPDFAKVYLTMYPSDKIIELKSLKQYVVHLRNIVVSYERLINIMYDHLMEVYEPGRLRLVMICNPRGGISSKLTIDSDWESRGGKELYQQGTDDDNWDVLM